MSKDSPLNLIANAEDPCRLSSDVFPARTSVGVFFPLSLFSCGMSNSGWSSDDPTAKISLETLTALRCPSLASSIVLATASPASYLLKQDCTLQLQLPKFFQESKQLLQLTKPHIWHQCCIPGLGIRSLGCDVQGWKTTRQNLSSLFIIIIIIMTVCRRDHPFSRYEIHLLPHTPYFFLSICSDYKNIMQCM